MSDNYRLLLLEAALLYERHEAGRRTPSTSSRFCAADTMKSISTPGSSMHYSTTGSHPMNTEKT